MKKINVIAEHIDIKLLKKYIKEHKETNITKKKIKEIKIKLEKENEIFEERVIDDYNKYLIKMKKYDDKIELIKYSEKNDVKTFYENAFKKIKLIDEFIIGENRYIYYEREKYWGNSNELMVNKDFTTALIFLGWLEQDNAIPVNFQEYFDNGKLIEPEQFETEEERQAYKEKLENALKPYY